MILKKNRILFVSEAKKIIVEMGMIQIESTPECEKYRLKTDKNTLELIVNGHEDHRYTYSVFGRLETPSPRVGNPYSGKVNFHRIAPVLEVIADFEDYLKELVETEL